MRVIFLGTPECSCPYLPAIEQAGGEIVAVVTQPDRPAGRGRRLCPPPVKLAAQARCLRLFQPATCRNPALIAELGALEPDIVLVVAFGQMLCPEFLSLPRVAALNVHYSLLPKLRGAAPVQHALLEGLTETGVTLQHLAVELDAGDIVGQRRLTIGADDDAATLTARLTALGVELVRELLPQVMAGTAPRIPQDHEKATWAPRLTKADSAIDWSHSALSISNRVRALNPWPGAYCRVGTDPLGIVRVRVVADFHSVAIPGTIVDVGKQTGPIVATGDGAVELVAVRPRGRRVMSGAEYMRGARLRAGDLLLPG
ncbi:MAG: methionyl-tRNA formyltransferase [Armatimonadetes bacterium]|nr:methionyl-tRNA formyltransferase [Armatimonadota bacterium]